MSRRDRHGPTLVTIWWRDVPAQVNGQEGGRRAQVVLPRRFQWTIERAAKRAGLTDVHEFTAQWRRTTQVCAGDVETAAREEAARLVALHPEARLRFLIRSGGLADGPEIPSGGADDSTGSTDALPVDDVPHGGPVP